MSVSLKLDKHIITMLGIEVPRNVGSVMPVNEHEHFKDRLII